MDEQKQAADLLGSTAYWTASARALENARPDGLIHDPWAEKLAGKTGAEWIAQRTPDKVLPIVLRTRYYDDFLQRIVRDYAVRQVVLLACGLDTRAFRLEWPEDTCFFELDQPAVLQYKESVLSSAKARPTCKRKVIEQNLTGPWQDALIKSGFNPQLPSVFLLEGFLFYLPSPQITHILEEVSPLAAPGSWLACDIINSVMLTHPLTKPWIEMQAASGAPWIGTLDEPVEFLSGLGWNVSLTQAGQPDASYGRWALPVLPTKMPNVPHNWFVTAQKS